MSEPTYFFATVLPPKHTLRGHDATDPSFFFNPEEKRTLDLRQVPLRCEHAASLPVGEVLNNWTVHDETYVVGRIDNDNVKSRFAKHAVSGNNPYYGSLSLKHGHLVFGDGSTKKRPIEVSLCQNPRRKGSSIRYVWQKTKKNTYKRGGSHACHKMPETSSDTVHAATAAEVTAQKDTSAMSKEDYMRIIIEQEAALEAMKKDKASAEHELQVIHEANAKKEAAQLEKAQKKAAMIQQSLHEDLKASLPESMLTPEVLESMRIVAQKMPEHAAAVYELCHAASEKHKQVSLEFKAFKSRLSQSESEAKFNAVMDKRAVQPMVEVKSTEHEASQKSRPRSATDTFQALAAKYNRSGTSLLDTMKQTYQGGVVRARKRRRPFE